MKRRWARIWLASGACLGVLACDLWGRHQPGGPCIAVILVALVAAALVWLLTRPRVGRSKTK